MARRRKRINPAKSLKLRLAPDVLSRFLAKVKLDGRGHWVWTGYVDDCGYGQFKVDGKAMWAHRIAYAVFRTSLPEGAEVDHRCKCTSCVNPWHLRKRSMAMNRSDTNRWATAEPAPF